MEYIFILWKGKNYNLGFLSSKNIFQNVKAKKDIFIKTKGKQIHHQEITTVRNVKGSFSNRGKMILDGNLDLHKRVKRYGNVNI